MFEANEKVLELLKDVAFFLEKLELIFQQNEKETLDEQ